MPQKHTPLARQSNLVIQELPDELLIYDLKINRAICLNSVSALVWQLCDGRNSVQEISRKISEKLGDLLNEDVVHLAIYQLNKNSLLKNDDRLNEIHFEGLSRRELVRKVGLLSAVALPVISQIAAPTAAMAQSCMGIQAPGFVIGCANGQPQCTNNSSTCQTCSATAGANPSPMCPAVGQTFLCVCD